MSPSTRSHNTTMTFFNLPPEIRNIIYSHLTQRREVDAFIKTVINEEPIRVVFCRPWIPHLLLISKKFTEEYFNEVCEHHPTCMVWLGPEDDPRPDDIKKLLHHVDPASAMKALGKARTLLGSVMADLPENIEIYTNSLTDPKFTGLLALMPNLRRYHEYLYIINSFLQYFMDCGDTTLLRALQEHHFGVPRMQALRQLQKTHKGMSRDIDYQAGSFLVDPLTCDRITQRSDWKSWLLYRATPAFVGEVKPEYLYYGCTLRPMMRKEENDDVVLLW